MSDLELVKRTLVAPVADKDQEVLLLERLKNKDPQALSEVYEAHSPAVYGSLLQLLDQPTAGEVLVDVFLKLWQQPDSFDAKRANLRVFLLVIARARALERQRSRKDQSLIDPEPEPEMSLEAVRPTLEGDSYKDAAWERREELRMAVQALSSIHREVVLRTFVHGESQESLARDLDIPVSTVKSRLNFALSALREVYDRMRQKGQDTTTPEHEQLGELLSLPAVIKVLDALPDDEPAALSAGPKLMPAPVIEPHEPKPEPKSESKPEQVPQAASQPPKPAAPKPAAPESEEWNAEEWERNEWRKMTGGNAEDRVNEESVNTDPNKTSVEDDWLQQLSRITPLQTSKPAAQLEQAQPAAPVGQTAVEVPTASPSSAVDTASTPPHMASQSLGSDLGSDISDVSSAAADAQVVAAAEASDTVPAAVSFVSLRKDTDCVPDLMPDTATPEPTPAEQSKEQG